MRDCKARWWLAAFWLVAFARPPWSCSPSDRAWGGAPSHYDLADLKALEQAFVELADKVRPSVVAIRAYKVRDAEQADTLVKVPISQGSGFVIQSDGYIATNSHVIEGADLISVVLFDGTRYEAKPRETDARSDLAVLKIEAEGLPAVRWGDASKVRVNQWTFACGNPFGLANNEGRASITFGTVSALGRQMSDRLPGPPQLHYYGNLIETTSTINPGSSGGPLFNLAGEVIGVVTAIETSTGFHEGSGFAVPIDKNTRTILDTLKGGQAMRYGFLGVSVDDVREPISRRVADAARPRGVRITALDPPNGPAATAGLKPDDVVTEFAGVPVESADHFVRLVGFTPVGAEVEMTYVRRQVQRKTTVTLGDRQTLLGFARRDE